MNDSSDSSQNHPTAPSPEPADHLPPEPDQQAAPAEPDLGSAQTEPEAEAEHVAPPAEPVVHSAADDIYGQAPSPEPAPEPDPDPIEPPLPDHLLAEAQRQERAQALEPDVVAVPIPAPAPTPVPEPEPATQALAHHVGAPEIADDAELTQARARRFGAERFEESADSQATRVLPSAEPTSATPNAAPATTPLPASTPAAAVPAAAAVGTGAASSAGQTTAARTPRADLFAGLEDMPASRAAAHWWVILTTLIFTPVAWFLISDGGDRFAHTLNTAGAVSVPALVQLVGGFVALFIVLLATRWSSVGPIIVGTLAAVAGATFFAIPDLTLQTLADYQHIFARLGQFGQTAYEQLLLDGTSGRLFAYGLVLVMAGVISHGARRQGRREERRRIALEL